MKKEEVREILASTPAERFPLPLAYADSAFVRCLMEAGTTSELVEQFDRLTGCKVVRIGRGPAIVQMVDKATGFQDEQIRQFAEFVHDCIYLRLPDEAIHALRLSSIELQEQ